MTEGVVERGWGWPILAKKSHYFVGGHSLCRRWLYFGGLENRNHGSKDNCTVCMKKRMEKYPEEK